MDFVTLTRDEAAALRAHISRLHFAHGLDQYPTTAEEAELLAGAYTKLGMLEDFPASEKDGEQSPPKCERECSKPTLNTRYGVEVHRSDTLRSYIRSPLNPEGHNKIVKPLVQVCPDAPPANYWGYAEV